MNKRELAKIDAIADMCEELKPEGRQNLLLKLLRQQKRLAVSEPIDKDNCSLIDLRRGAIVGSGICPECRGWIGRAPDYLD
jgi:hypothetical protein